MKPQSPTQISITIDTEFSIAGHFQSPEKYQPVSDRMVYGEIDGREEALGFLLDTFQQHNISATFFVECANYFFFGDEPMQTVVNRIKAARQDIQLHIHPVWLHFAEGKIPGNFPRNDFCSDRSYEDLHHVFSLCIEVFERWTGKRPEAIRTGSLVADENVFKVMQALEIPLSSNIATGIYYPPEHELQHDSGRHSIHGVTELPVFSYQDMNLAGKRHRKSLQITSCSWPEMKRLLTSAREAGVESIVILTHPSEFMKKSDFRYTRITRNRVNQQRLKNLCAFIEDNPQDFESADFGSNVDTWGASPLSQPYFALPSYFAIGRKLHNKLNDLIWRY